MGRSEQLFEVQHYVSNLGWLTQSPAGGKPVWFRSLESARVDLQAEMMLRCGDVGNVGDVGDMVTAEDEGRKQRFNPLEYRITDGKTVWKPAWNADGTALIIRNVGARDITEPGAGKSPSRLPAPGRRVRLFRSGEPPAKQAPTNQSTNQ